MAEILQDLNAHQREAVTAGPGPLLVLAGPGTGKTHVITRRAAWLIANEGAPPQSVLCITFTNRAAEEMQLRLASLLGEGSRDIWVYTFHALCTRLLRRNAAAVGLDPHFVVADEQTQAAILEQAVRDRDLSAASYPVYRVSEFISEYKRNLQDPAHAPIEGNVTAELVALAADYGSRLRARNLLDFDDLIRYAVRLLGQERTVRAAMTRALPHILIDEFQDVNRAQFEFLKLVAPSGHDVLVVADEAQSIYGWRGAQPGLLAAFEKQYKPKVITLDESYRSTQTLRFAAEGLIRHDPRPYRPAASTRSESGAPIYHWLFDTARQEQAWLVQLIQKLTAERGYRHADIAVLYRTHQLANDIEGALLQARIPVERIRRESYFQQSSAREIVRYLHLARSLTSDDLLAAFNFPQALADEFTVLQLSYLADVHNLSLAELARRANDFPELSPLTRAALGEFVQMIDEQLAPLAEMDARTAVTALLDALARRRSPLTADEFRLLREATATLSYPEIAAAMRDHLEAEGQIHVAGPATLDGVCALAIVRDALREYLGVQASVEVLSGAHEARLSISLGAGRPALSVQPPPGSLPYSLSFVAWRLVQDLLAAHESLGTGLLVVYDLETTGLDVSKDEIVEIAAQRIDRARPVGTRFYSLVRPEHGIPISASRVHGITAEEVRGADRIESVLPRFLRYVGSQTVVGHNIIGFDNRFIDREAGRALGRGFPNAAVDTLLLAQRLFSGDPALAGRLDLEGLVASLGLGQAVEHRAGADVEQIIALFRYLLRENTVQRGLRSLAEYLPLVAVGMAAAGVPLTDENLAVWRGAQRLRAQHTQGREVAGLAAAHELLNSDGQSQLAAALEELEQGVQPGIDDEWLRLRESFDEQVESFLRFSSDRSLAAFLDYQALVTGQDTARGRLSEAGADTGDGKVSMMTIHNAKGTEYPVVIIIGVEEDVLPLWSTVADEGQLREERRVFYVGVTRAEQQLYLTSVRKRGEAFTRSPSRFAYELPREYVQRYRVVSGAEAAAGSVSEEASES